jgi:SnoaL-like domain
MSAIPMSAIDVAYQYFGAWNRHDAAGVVATLAPNGTYTDPTTRGPLSGEALISYINGIVSAFPDLSFEIISAAPAGDGLVAGQWLMKGTNTGPYYCLGEYRGPQAVAPRCRSQRGHGPVL